METVVLYPCSTDSNKSEPIRYRATQDLIEYWKNENIAGIEGLKLSASGIPSKENISFLKENLPEGFIVIDLIYEPHALVDGTAIVYQRSEPINRKQMFSEDEFKKFNKQSGELYETYFKNINSYDNFIYYDYTSISKGKLKVIGEQGIKMKLKNIIM